MSPSFTFEARLWLYPGKAGWVFATLPTETSDEILEAAPSTGGFGSVKVDVLLGNTTWSTSLFPDQQAGSFVLPVKKAVRDAESIDVGDTIRITVTLAAAAAAGDR